MTKFMVSGVAVQHGVFDDCRKLDDFYDPSRNVLLACVSALRYTVQTVSGSVVTPLYLPMAADGLPHPTGGGLIASDSFFTLAVESHLIVKRPELTSRALPAYEVALFNILRTLGSATSPRAVAVTDYKGEIALADYARLLRRRDQMMMQLPSDLRVASAAMPLATEDHGAGHGIWPKPAVPTPVPNSAVEVNSAASSHRARSLADAVVAAAGVSATDPCGPLGLDQRRFYYNRVTGTCSACTKCTDSEVAIIPCSQFADGTCMSAWAE